MFADLTMILEFNLLESGKFAYKLSALINLLACFDHEIAGLALLSEAYN